MKKSKLLAVCIIGILMVVGLILMGCDKGCSGVINCVAVNNSNTHRDSCFDSSCVVTNYRDSKNTTGSDIYCDC
jgi:uncharacterized lipoprotein NlpE involved in copper resistance